MNNRSIMTLVLGVLLGGAARLTACGGGESPAQPSPKVRAVSLKKGRAIADTIGALDTLVVDVRNPITGAPRPGIEVRFVLLDTLYEVGYLPAAAFVGSSSRPSTAVDTTNALGEVMSVCSLATSSEQCRSLQRLRRSPRRTRAPSR